MMLFTDRAGVRLAYQVDGSPDRPALLLSNSLGSTMALWDEQVGVLSHRYCVIRYDLRGHGESAAVPRDYTLDELGHDALAVLDACRVARAHVCGISLGGMTAMWLAAHASSRVNHLVLANTGARIGSDDMWQGRIAQVRAEGMAAIARQAMGRWFTSAFIAEAPDTVRNFQAMLEGCDPAGYVGCCAALRDADVRPVLRSIRARTLVIAGTHDPATPVADHQALRDAIRGAQLVELDAAHLSNVEQPRAFTDAVLTLLSASL
jgi:3-oxoadipate enol-lactonase